MSTMRFRMRFDLITKLQLSAFHYFKNSAKNYDVRNRRNFPVLVFESPSRACRVSNNNAHPEPRFRLAQSYFFKRCVAKALAFISRAAHPALYHVAGRGRRVRQAGFALRPLAPGIWPGPRPELRRWTGCRARHLAE